LIRILEYLDPSRRSPFGRWLAALDVPAAARVTAALYRLAEGNVSNVRSVGGGVLELRVHFGPGYRVYFVRRGSDLVVLLGGGSKKQQAADVAAAWRAWRELRRRERTDS
jgi:putative addiction module killer protein